MTDSYRVRIKKSAEKEMRALPPPPNLKQVISRIRAFAAKPGPVGCEPLSGGDRYRIRQGDYRMVYVINDDRRIVEIMKIGHRRDVYRT